MNLGLETAISLKAGACWVNCHNLFDAAAGFGGYRESGYGRDGGKEVRINIILLSLVFSLHPLLSTLLHLSLQGLYEYAKPSWQERPRPQVDEGKVKNFGQNVAPRPLNPAEKQLQLYPVAMEINGVEAPRYVSVFRLSCLLHSSTCTSFHLPFLFLPPFPLSLSLLPFISVLLFPQHRPHPQDVYWWCSEASRCPLCQTRHEPLWEDCGPGV